MNITYIRSVVILFLEPILSYLTLDFVQQMYTWFIMQHILYKLLWMSSVESKPQTASYACSKLALNASGKCGGWIRRLWPNTDACHNADTSICPNTFTSSQKIAISKQCTRSLKFVPEGAMVVSRGYPVGIRAIMHPEYRSTALHSRNVTITAKLGIYGG